MASDMPPPSGDDPYQSPHPRSFEEGTPFGNYASAAPQVGPEVLKADVVGQPWVMDYTGCFSMIQRRPDWFMNILLTGVCSIIPVVGGIAATGYCFEAAEVLHRTGGAFYPKFDFNRFVDYLIRGVGPFLLALLFAVVQAPLLLAMYIAFFALLIGGGVIGEGAGQNQQPQFAAVALLGGMLLIFSAFVVISAVAAVVQLPLTLRGGMSSDIGETFRFRWGLDFLKKMWWELILSILFLWACSIPLMLIALITCYLGLIPGIGYLMLIYSWLFFQLYRVYLSRYGEPIPFLKPVPIITGV